MSERLMLFLVSILITLTCLSVIAWTVISRQALYMDGLLTVFTCLVLALIFGLNALSMMPKKPPASKAGESKPKRGGSEQADQAKG
ncbi:MAG: hypothetical protein HY650_08745 [Acidobacteria bacterium]|nr:hypothetical protein [Acidobacteriota bacterium]